MKYSILGITAFLLSNLVAAPALPQTPRALEIGLLSIGVGIDQQALEAVRSIIAKAVAEGVIDTYITDGYDFEGGRTYCIQLSPEQSSGELLELKSEFLQIEPNPTTPYQVRAVAACTPPPRSPIQVSELVDSELADTEWLLEDLGGTDVIGPQNPTLRFLGTDRIGGQGGCNLYSAKSQIEGDRLAVSTLIATKRACVDPQAQEQEDRYFRALESAQRFSLEGLQLLIYSEGFDEPLKFSRLGPSSQSEE